MRWRWTLILLAAALVPGWLWSAAIDQVTADQVERWLDDPAEYPLLVDLRPREAFEQGHIDGAVFGGEDPSQLWLDQATRHVVLVGVAPDSPLLLKWQDALAGPDRDVRYLPGGPAQWQRAGLALTTPLTVIKERPAFLIPNGLCDPRDPVMIFNPR